jgi:hypothetical protein
MALVKFILSLTTKDADNEVFATPLYGEVDDTTTIAALVTEAQAAQDLVDAVLDGQLVKCRYLLEVPMSGTIKSDPVAGSEIERTGLISFDVADTVYSFAIDLAAFALTKFIGNAINMSDADVAALIEALVDGLGSLGFTDKYGNPLLEALVGRKTFRKHRRQTKRT